MAEMQKFETAPITPNATTPINDPPVTQKTGRGVKFYIRGSWLFFKKMWPAIYELTTTETYVNASAIAFNVMLSFFSFAVLVGSFLLHVVGSRRAYETFFRLMRSMVPKESGLLFSSLDQVTTGPGGKATLFSFAVLIFSASGVFQPLEAALNRAWKFKERDFIKQYAVYMLLALFCAMLILFPVALGTAYDFVLERLFGSDIRNLVFEYLGPLLALPFIITLFFVIYYFVPNGKVQLNQVVFTSVATAVLWMLATLGFYLALPLFDFSGSYKGLSSIMALVTWVFISSFLLILGAELSARQIMPQLWTGWLPLKATQRLDKPPAQV